MVKKYIWKLKIWKTYIDAKSKTYNDAKSQHFCTLYSILFQNKLYFSVFFTVNSTTRQKLPLVVGFVSSRGIRLDAKVIKRSYWSKCAQSMHNNRVLSRPQHLLARWRMTCLAKCSPNWLCPWMSSWSASLFCCCADSVFASKWQFRKD